MVGGGGAGGQNLPEADGGSVDTADVVADTGTDDSGLMDSGDADVDPDTTDPEDVDTGDADPGDDEDPETDPDADTTPGGNGSDTSSDDAEISGEVETIDSTGDLTSCGCAAGTRSAPVGLFLLAPLILLRRRRESGRSG